MSQQLFEYVSQNPDFLSTTVADLKPQELAYFAKSLRSEDRKVEVIRLQMQKYQDKVQEAKAAIEGALKSKTSKGGLSKESIELIEEKLKIL